MGGRIGTIAVVAFTAFATFACRDASQDVPTSPELAVRNGCNFTTVSALTKDEFGAGSTETGLATDMKSAGSKTDQATFLGYSILTAVADKYAETPTASTSNAAGLTVALLSCMNVGVTPVPVASVFEAALGLSGAFGVTGLNNSADAAPVVSHDGAWTFEPQGGNSPIVTWAAMTTVLNLGSTDPRITHAVLVYGRPTPLSDFTQDQVANGIIFDWSTLPKASFDPTVVIGECTLESNYLQHESAKDNPGTVEVLGFLKPTCYQPAIASAEAAPRSFAERVVRFFSPQPAFAALATTKGSGGTSACKTCLSPFEVVLPVKTTLLPGFQWKKSGNAVNTPIAPTVNYQIQTAKATDFKQKFVLVWLEATNNSGTNVRVCNNWAYTDDSGVARFPKAYLNKAGGYTITTKTAGALSLTTAPPNSVTITTPTVPPSDPLLSPLVNVKNSSLPAPDLCPNFDGNTSAPPEAPGPNG
jgi:hypothetical protein